MSLSQVLNTAVGGLRTTQAGLSLVAANVANAQTPGYIRKSLVQQTTTTGDSGIGVRVAAIARELDVYIQRQLRVESAGGAYAETRAQFYDRLQHIFGQPGSTSALETVFNNFTSAIQTLTTSPESTSARSALLTSAQVLTQQLNSMTAGIQNLRADAENGIADAVAYANEAMRQIASINGQLAAMSASDAAAASLADQRDIFIDRLAQLMDIRVVVDESNQVNIFTNSGIQLVGARAAQLSFNPQATMTAATQWSADPTSNTVGSLMLVSPSGATVDLIADKAIRAGQIAAYVEMRDVVLVQAQAQIDGFAAAMAQALSDVTVAATPVSVGAQNGFEIDVSGLLPGNTISLNYTDTTSGQKRQVTIVRVDNPSLLPLDNSVTASPHDHVIGIDFSAGPADVANQLNAHFNGKLTFDSPGSGILRVLDDGATDTTSIDAFTARRTVSGLGTGVPEFALFTDGSIPYTGAITASGPQVVGLAGRISVNSALLGDPAKLVLYGPGTSAGDPTRPDLMYKRLTDTRLEFLPDTGIGSPGTPFSGSLPDFLRQMLSQQGAAAAAAANLSEGQTVVVNALKQRISDAAGVNVDYEMASLLTLQTAYAANARVMAAVREMLDMLMNI